MAPAEFKYREDMYNDLRSSQYVRVAEDAIPDQSMFAYRYFKGHLLEFGRRKVPDSQIKRILRDSLRGLAAMHEKHIIHVDVKPNNIVFDYEGEDNSTFAITSVQLADIEDAMYIPEGCAISGLDVGNWMWRSPEAHAACQVGPPSDVFSFGLVVSL